MLAAGTWMVLATALRLPCLCHTLLEWGQWPGLAWLLPSVPIMWNKFADIFLGLAPHTVGRAILGMIIYKILLRWLADSKFYNERLIRILLTQSGIYMAFSWGAN